MSAWIVAVSDCHYGDLRKQPADPLEKRQFSHDVSADFDCYDCSRRPLEKSNTAFHPSGAPQQPAVGFCGRFQRGREPSVGLADDELRKAHGT